MDFRLIFAVKWPPATIGCHFLASDGDGNGDGNVPLELGNRIWDSFWHDLCQQRDSCQFVLTDFTVKFMPPTLPLASLPQSLSMSVQVKRLNDISNLDDDAAAATVAGAMQQQ